MPTPLITALLARGVESEAYTKAPWPDAVRDALGPYVTAAPSS